MKVTKEKVKDIAHLARLEFEESELQKIQEDMMKVLSFCEKLNELNTSTIDPLIYMTTTHNNVREDITIQNFSKEEVLFNAPKKDSDYFRVPKVIEQDK